jgi:hypothetical protein
MPSIFSFHYKPDDLVPCLNRLKVTLSVPEVMVLSLSRKLFESRELTLATFVGWGIGIRLLDRSEE